MINHNKKTTNERASIRSSLTTIPVIGWREWVSFPELGIPQIKAKIDTGARTSALHAFAIEPLSENGRERIRFSIHPIQNNTNDVITCIADVVDRRLVTDSGGHEEERYVIYTPIMIADRIWPIEVTLTARETMLFRMLLGRSAIKRHFMINPGRSFLLSRRV